MLELRIAVRMLIPLDRLAVALETVAHPTQKNSHHAAAGAVSQTFQCLGKTARALARPTQWRHRIAARQRLHKAFQLFRQIGLVLNRRFAPASGSANSSLRQNIPGLDFALTCKNRASGNLCHARHQRGAAVSKRAGLRGGPDASRTLIQKRAQSPKLLANRGFRRHPISLLISRLYYDSYFIAVPKGVDALEAS